MNSVNLRYLDTLTKRYQLNHFYSVTLDELELALFTSRRNVTTVMKNLALCGWVDWKPAVGRSKSSRLKVTKSLQQALSAVFLHELEQSQSKVIAKLLECYGLTAVRALNIAAEELSQKNEQGNSVLISCYPAVNTLDPAKTYREAELHVIKSVYDTLLKQDKDGVLRPGLAHAWETNDRVVTIWLRPLVYRHDGELLSVNDVAWSLERLRDSSGPVRDLIRCIEKVEIASSNKIEITLHYPNRLFTYALAMPYTAIVCRDQLCFGHGYTCSIGTGPYKVENWNKERIALKAHNDFYSARALIEKVTLSHNTDIFENALSFNQVVGEVEVESINALSYLTYRERKNSELSPETWYQLAEFISRSKYQFDKLSAAEGVELKNAVEPTCSETPPSLIGRVVIAEPVWTIPSLIRNTKWLHRVIRSTGLELEVYLVEDISCPEEASHHADLMLVEEVIESPLEYGLYEWLSVSTGLRFALTDQEMEAHQGAIRDAVGADESLQKLTKIEQSLYETKRCVPLFCGQEEVAKAQQVRGVQVNPTGYSDFYKLWIAR